MLLLKRPFKIDIQKRAILLNKHVVKVRKHFEDEFSKGLEFPDF